MIVKIPSHNRALAGSVPGAHWDAGEDSFVFDPDLNARGREVALQFFPALREQLTGEVTGHPKHFRPIDMATPWAKDTPANALLPHCSITTPMYRYQAVDLGFAAARLRVDGGAYLGWDRGLGKTLGAIALAEELQCDRIIVVAPNQSKELVWRPEIEKWDTHDRPIYNVQGNAEHRERALADWTKTGGYLLVHYEALRLVTFPKADMVIVDESHRLANGSASTSAPLFYKALKRIKSTYRLALSGSIITNSAEDFFGALHWLFPKRYRSRWRDWNNRFLLYQFGGFGKVLIGPNPKTMLEMRQELASFMVVRLKNDELPDLPAITVQQMRVTLSKGQRRVYDDLAKQFLANLPDGSSLLAPNVAVQLIRLRQVATGMDLLGDQFTDSSKLEAAEEVIEATLPNKVVVFVWHRRTAYALVKRLHDRGILGVSCVTGDSPMAKRPEMVRNFCEGENNVLIATIKTLGESVNLQAASDMIFVESSWTAADMDQARDRIYRNGQKKHVTITHIIAADTVDETHIMPKVADKAALRRMLLGGYDVKEVEYAPK